ncbi:hypothetical protein NIES2109_59960 (plasmid) [Nostoc sp. HK-01]|uniref:CopG domain protein DNA-binding domain protein n=1 Tax=Anabaenopsis circularis NIES-21 TaxID=1085406 RepID=A0A1Z4GRM6_9CYAN|nr:hypothetical protein NIES21_60250 [Anabaenopsis circularis NIES-21]BBD63146.1 hypothetical protein NIES2109_59960 [Nostoc sp. HK-01]
MMIPTQMNASQHLFLPQNTLDLDLDPDELQIIDDYCQQTGRTYSEVIQQLVQQFLALQEST